MSITPDEARALAATLRKIAPAYVRQDPDRPGMRTRYCGGEPYFDVYLDVEDGAPVWFQLTVRGLSVTWSPDGGAVTGKTNELQVADNPFPGSKILTDDRTRSAETIAIARAILDARAEEPHFATVSKALAA